MAKDIILGALASLIASIVWFYGGRLISARKSREKISFLLEMLYDCVDQFDTAIVFGLTDTAEAQADKILEYCARIREEQVFFTFIGKKKKLFNTILYNLSYTTSFYKRLWVGYNGEVEKEGILNKFKRKYYYQVQIFDEKESVDKQSFMIFSVTLLQALNNQNSVTKALKDNYFINEKWNVKLKETYLGLIAAKNFKSGITSNKYDFQNSIFTKEEYEKYLDEKLKGVSV